MNKFLFLLSMCLCSSQLFGNLDLSYDDRFEIYHSIDFKGHPVNQDVFNYAFKGYLKLNETGQLEKPHLLSIIDYSKASIERRFWVLDLNTRQVLFDELVSHGEGSGDLYAQYFSDIFDSRQSSLGFFVTGRIYDGKHAYSLKLHGVEEGFNSNAYQRGIVIHGADYVSERFIQDYNSIGRSFGCPAIRQNIKYNLISTIAYGSCLFSYYPSQTYLQYSSLLH